MSPPEPGQEPALGPARTYEIQETSLLTGLAPARLRAWERRYEVVRPRRLQNGYRAYSPEQVALLRVLAELVAQGERIGELVEQPVTDLLHLAAQRRGSWGGPLLQSIAQLDRGALEALVDQQVVSRGARGFAHDIALPLARELGDRWALGQLPIAAEHLASEVVVGALKAGLRSPASQAMPLCVAACVPGERHEWGLLASMTELGGRGWRIEYLGPDLPLDDVVEAAWKRGAAAVALSASEAELVDRQAASLRAVPARLPGRALAAIGGRGALARSDVLREAGFLVGLEALLSAASSTGPGSDD